MFLLNSQKLKGQDFLASVPTFCIEDVRASITNEGESDALDYSINNLQPITLQYKQLIRKTFIKLE